MNNERRETWVPLYDMSGNSTMYVNIEGEPVLYTEREYEVLEKIRAEGAVT